MNIQPLGDRIVVKVREQVAKTKSGIYVPDTAKDRPQEADVLAVGPGARNEKGERRIQKISENYIITSGTSIYGNN